jgi:integrase
MTDPRDKIDEPHRRVRPGCIRGERSEGRGKTGAEWSIPVRAPIAALLDRQRASRARESEGWVFPNDSGQPINHANWIKRGWAKALARGGGDSPRR